MSADVLTAITTQTRLRLSRLRDEDWVRDVETDPWRDRRGLFQGERYGVS